MNLNSQVPERHVTSIMLELFWHSHKLILHFLVSASVFDPGPGTGSTNVGLARGGERKIPAAYWTHKWNKTEITKMSCYFTGCVFLEKRSYILIPYSFPDAIGHSVDNEQTSSVVSYDLKDPEWEIN